MIQKPAPNSLKYKVVGICGKAGSGKDTIAEYLDRRSPQDELWVHKFALADLVKDVASHVFDVDRKLFDNREFKERELTSLPNYSPRKLAQLVGTDCFRDVFGIWVWVAALHRKLQNIQLVSDAVIITDIRFQSEMQWILEQDGILVRVERDAAPVINSHISEMIPPISFCQNAVEAYGGSLVVIENNGSLVDLHQAIEKQLVPLLLTSTQVEDGL